MIIEYISFSGIAVSLLSILLLFSKKEKKHSDYYLIFWLFICIFNLGYYLFPSVLPQAIQSVGFTLPVLSISVLYLYVISITFSIEFDGKYILKHSLFFIFYNLLFIGISNFYTEIIFTHNIPYFAKGNQGIILDFLALPMALIPIFYIVLSYRALRKYQKILPEYYSTLEKINLNWLKYIFVSLIILLIVIIGVISLGSRSYYIPVRYVFKIVGTIQSVYIFFIVFFGLRQSILINHSIVFTDLNSEPYKEKAAPSDGRFDIISQNLLQFMGNEKPYLDEELSLSKLSSLLGISTNQLSQVINQNLNTNFYKFVNSYRIKEVQVKLKDSKYDHYSILGIAFESGFNSKSTFNKIFKEETGMTPSEYKKSR
jgi:AraC-like DNA-binding protein